MGTKRPPCAGQVCTAPARSVTVFHRFRLSPPRQSLLTGLLALAALSVPLPSPGLSEPFSDPHQKATGLH